MRNYESITNKGSETIITTTRPTAKYSSSSENKSAKTHWKFIDFVLDQKQSTKIIASERVIRI